MAEIIEDPCPACAHTCVASLGTLGNLIHFRCRACNWEFNRELPEEPEGLDDYLKCALWSSTHEDGTPFDRVDAELSNEARATAARELADFRDAASKTDWGGSNVLEAYLEDNSDAQFAHDFWLTRNGHGAGFWDRGLGTLGDVLTELSKAWGSCDAYLGDDNQIHFT